MVSWLPRAEQTEPNEKIAVCATEGGVGKTTLTANIGAIIANAGNRVPLIDVDPQASLSTYYLGDASVLREPGIAGLTSILTATDTPAPDHTNIPYLEIILSDNPSG